MDTKIQEAQLEAIKLPTPDARIDPPPYVLSLTAEERDQAEKKLVRKIDGRLLPPIIVMYLLNYIDRNNIASARLGGLEEDLGLHGSQYQTGKRPSR